MFGHWSRRFLRTGLDAGRVNPLSEDKEQGTRGTPAGRAGAVMEVLDWMRRQRLAKTRCNGNGYRSE